MVKCTTNEGQVVILRDDDGRDFDELSVPEKIQLVQDLWDRNAQRPQDVELTTEQIEEAERRLREHEKNPGKTVTWEELRRRLESSSAAVFSCMAKVQPPSTSLRSIPSASRFERSEAAWYRWSSRNR